MQHNPGAGCAFLPEIDPDRGCNFRGPIDLEGFMKNLKISHQLVLLVLTLMVGFAIGTYFVLKTLS